MVRPLFDIGLNWSVKCFTVNNFSHTYARVNQEKE
jgi:hypothetical protein